MNEIKILGFCGKKQSGKNTSSNYILGVFLEALEICREFKITPKGELWVSDIFGNTEYAGILDLNCNSIATKTFAEEHIYPFVKLYSFADLLKKNVCIDILGLSYEQCFGSDNDKKTLTNIKWEDMPGVICDKEEYIEHVDAESKSIIGRLGSYYEKSNKFIYHESGPMTAREVMQFVGTEVFRKMYNNVWVDATIRQIEKDSPSMAIITDVRFPNEVNGIINCQDFSSIMTGKVIRLTRNVYPEDKHPSEIALDSYNESFYSHVINNQEMSIQEQNKHVYDFLSSIQWVPHHVPEEILQRLPVE